MNHYPWGPEPPCTRANIFDLSCGGLIPEIKVPCSNGEPAGQTCDMIGNVQEIVRESGVFKSIGFSYLEEVGSWGSTQPISDLGFEQDVGVRLVKQIE